MVDFEQRDYIVNPCHALLQYRRKEPRDGCNEADPMTEGDEVLGGAKVESQSSG